MKTLDNIWEVALSLDGKEVFDKVLVSTEELNINSAIEKAERYVKETYRESETDETFASAQALSVMLTGQTVIL